MKLGRLLNWLICDAHAKFRVFSFKTVVTITTDTKNVHIQVDRIPDIFYLTSHTRLQAQLKYTCTVRPLRTGGVACLCATYKRIRQHPEFAASVEPSEACTFGQVPAVAAAAATELSSLQREILHRHQLLLAPSTDPVVNELQKLPKVSREKPGDES